MTDEEKLQAIQDHKAWMKDQQELDWALERAIFALRALTQDQLGCTVLAPGHRPLDKANQDKAVAALERIQTAMFRQREAARAAVPDDPRPVVRLT